jgi:hypothetical protein
VRGVHHLRICLLSMILSVFPVCGGSPWYEIIAGAVQKCLPCARGFTGHVGRVRRDV